MSDGGADALTVLVSSPLLIPHVRSPGGSGGRRIRAGLADDRDGGQAFALAVEAGGRQPSLRLFGSALACAHAFNDELRRADRDGLHASPPAQTLSEQALLDARESILG